ncbi:PiggyBac transposase uribo2 [Plakobranchus ocellatus]|uniref:PiggyBac transposase uribo2 n=1 Tax=Plakobranchus ocellatus TaxID=259542 RepID=A0AAV3YUG2_9GAST|nr:PiggyBac transposase uribo2 [Plakobranchus ocellatus]
MMFKFKKSCYEIISAKVMCIVTGYWHQLKSDSSDSDSGDSEDDRSRSRNETLEDENGWVEVTKESDFRPAGTLKFTVRQPMSSKNIPEDCKEPQDFFSLFLDDEFWRLLCRETNNYADQFFNSEAVRQWLETHPSSRYKKWPADGVSISRFRKHIGLLINMGLTHKNVSSSYWTTRKSQATPYFGSIMGVDEFNRISRMIHLNNVEAEIPRGREGHDPWSKVRPILDKINQKSKHHYTSSQNVSIDESMIGMKNRCVFIQYMPNKRHAPFGVNNFSCVIAMDISLMCISMLEKN